ncbi:MAG TPA: hypothetical protein VGY48_07590 [Vicinamibacterales bacterium]|jgi:hypothetical protein|nr:hypothetical protein [Vicinamibacterales bacterium]
MRIWDRLRRHGIWAAIALAGLWLTRVSPVSAQTTPSAEFFIISSINPAKQQVLVKRPTEVTQVMRVDEHTKYIDRTGKAIALADLRAGDTVYIMLKPKTDSVVEIRKGPMTVAELQRRYLQSKN